MEKIIVAFNSDLHRFFMQEGYAYLYALGMVHENPGPDPGNEFLLVPLKPEALLFLPPDQQPFVDPIEGPEVYEMAAGDDCFRFVVELPLEDYEKYLIS